MKQFPGKILYLQEKCMCVESILIKMNNKILETGTKKKKIMIVNVTNKENIFVILKINSKTFIVTCICSNNIYLFTS